MPRTANKDSKNLNLIVIALKDASEGLWIREIARRTKLDPKTVTYYVSRYQDLFDEQTVEGPNKPVFRLIKLRPGALTRPGAMLSKILKEHGR
jgi:hypothetical protein